jgi:hypothetical protein
MTPYISEHKIQQNYTLPLLSPQGLGLTASPNTTGLGQPVMLQSLVSYTNVLDHQLSARVTRPWLGPEDCGSVEGRYYLVSVSRHGYFGK